MTEGVYTHKCYLYYGDYDANGQLKISTVLRFLSDIAGIAYASIGYSRDWLLEHGQVFLLSQFRVKFLQMPHQDEHILVETWETGTKGVLFLRNFRIVAEDGSSVAEASSTWVLVDPADHRILRPRELAGKQNPVELACKPGLPEKLHYDPDKLLYTENAVHTVRYSDLDLNQHVYNAKYADILYDALPIEDTCKKAVEFQIHYKKEAKPGDRLKVGYEKNGSQIIAVGTLENDEVSFVAKVVFADNAAQ